MPAVDNNRLIFHAVNYSRGFVSAVSDFFGSGVFTGRNAIFTIIPKAFIE
jgi:hypothetical protein